MNSTALFSLSAAALLLAAAAHADILPPATGDAGYLSSTGDLIFVQGGPDQFLDNVESPTVSQTAQSSTSQQVSAEVSGQGNAGAGLEYSFEVAGPASTSPINVMLEATLIAAGNFPFPIGNGNSGVGILFTDGNGCCLLELGATPFMDTVFDGPLSVMPNTVITVDMNAGSMVGVQDFGDFADSFASLFLSLDPAQAGEGYSLIFSDGITNEPVPEAGTLALAGAGLLLVALARRRTA